MDTAIRDRLEKWIDAHFDEMLSDIADMVRIPSVATYDDPGTPYGPDCLKALPVTHGPLQNAYRQK